MSSLLYRINGVLPRVVADVPTGTNLGLFHLFWRVRIGRTLQSFPPSKRSERLSTHSAFQLGLWTLQGRIHRYR
jgi:hypothetical protein